jgi:hypothetical protein
VRNVSETPLEMEERHIAQFEALITKQELLLIELERDGRVEAGERARQIIAETQKFLRFAWKRHSQLVRAKL